MVKIKICGLKTKEDVQCCVDNSADYIGFVFHDSSPRNILPEKVPQIPDDIKTVAVIVNKSNQELNNIFKYFTPDYLQLHGNEDVNRVSEIKDRYSVKIIKSFSISCEKDLDEIYPHQDICDMILLDSSYGGGSGKTFDWSILNDFNISIPWFLSGGLNIDNIEDAIKISNAKYIDISSGVEDIKGIKSHIKIKKLLNILK